MVDFSVFVSSVKIKPENILPNEFFIIAFWVSKFRITIFWPAGKYFMGLARYGATLYLGVAKTGSATQSIFPQSPGARRKRANFSVKVVAPLGKIT